MIAIMKLHSLKLAQANTTMWTEWSNKCRTGITQLTNQPANRSNSLRRDTNCSWIVTRVVCVCSNSCAIWIWHYPSTPFIQIAVIFIPLQLTHSSRRAAFIWTFVGRILVLAFTTLTSQIEMRNIQQFGHKSGIEIRSFICLDYWDFVHKMYSGPFW